MAVTDAGDVWAGVAGWWREHADRIDDRSAPVTAAMLDAADVGPGERVLELACGPGGVGLAAAGRVGPEGAVVLSDASPAMTAVAAARARTLGLANVSTRELDLEAIAEPDGTFDVAVCRDGLMLASDPDRAAHEIRRVLAPGGRVAVVVWAAQEQNPWLGTLLDAVSDELGMPVPPPGVAGPFSLGAPDRLGAILRDAGFTGVEVDELANPYGAASFEEWWSLVPGGAGPLAQIIESLPDATRDSIRERSRDALAPYEASEGLTIPGSSLLASARRS